MEILSTGLLVKSFRRRISSNLSSTLMVRLHAAKGQAKLIHLVDRFQHNSLQNHSKNTKKRFGNPITIALKKIKS